MLLSVSSTLARRGLSSSFCCKVYSSRHRNTRWLSSVPNGGDNDDESETKITTDASANLAAQNYKWDHLSSNLKPCEVVRELDRHIVGQSDAKRAVAIALRNRWRRKLLPPELRKEVTPRNVLMIGPTGCGKTEVARRMAELGGAPFIKVEATKFTEVGYHGRDVDQIIRDLVDISMNLTKKQQTEKLKSEAEALAEERLLDLLAGVEVSYLAQGYFRIGEDVHYL